MPRSSSFPPLPTSEADRGSAPLRVPVAPCAVTEVAALVDGRRGTTEDRKAQHAAMLAAVQRGFTQLFGRSVALQVGDDVLIEAGTAPHGPDVDPQESKDLDEAVWAERLHTDASAKVPTDRRWFLVVLAQGALGRDLPNVDGRSLDDLFDMGRVRAAAPLAHAFRARRGPWVDVPGLYGHAPRLLVQGKAAFEAVLAAGGPNGDLLFHPDLRAFRVRNRQQRRAIHSPADLYYFLMGAGPLQGALPERAEAWRQAATARALAEPLREVASSIGTARNALACLVDLQQVVLDPVRSADHPGYAFDAGEALTDAWRAPLDTFLAQAMSIKAHLDDLGKSEQAAQSQVRRTLGKTVEPF